MESEIRPRLHIVMVEPRIPQNTGNVSRTCAVTGAVLHLVKPYGFTITDSQLKRAGLDYWDKLDVRRYMNYEEFLEKNPDAHIYFATTKAKHVYTEVEYGENDYIMFGKESAGIPEEILVEHPDDCIRIPMLPEIRSLNLSNSVNIVLYEALRQNNFKGLETEGELHRLHW